MNDDQETLVRLHQQDAVAPFPQTGTIEVTRPFMLCNTNNLGGTSPLPLGRYKVGVTRGSTITKPACAWWDG